MAALAQTLEVRVRDLPALKLLVALLALVTYEAAYQAEHDPGETRADWVGKSRARDRAPLMHIDADKLVKGRLQIKRGRRWVAL